MSRVFTRWKDMIPVEAAVDPADPQAMLRYVRKAFRALNDFLETVNDSLETTVGVTGRLTDVFELAYNVNVGYLTYFEGSRMQAASLANTAFEPLGVVESIISAQGGFRRGYVWCAAVRVSMAVEDESVEPGARLYLSATPGLATVNAPAVNGTTVTYQAPVGWAVGRASDGMVEAVFLPSMPRKFL